MLSQGSIADIKNGLVPNDDTHIVVTMRFYPRFLRKEFRDEFICDLAPSRELLHEFNAAQKRLGNHNDSFAAVDYERRFQLNDAALGHLDRLAALSKTTDVYLICICATGERCHREMLLLLSHELYGCKTGKVFHAYPDFIKRLPEFTARAL